jgi:hypothetical protein
MLKRWAHSVAILLHVHHVFCKSSEPLHFHVMFTEHILEEATSIIQAAIARLLRLSWAQSMFMTDLSLIVLMVLLMRLRAWSHLVHRIEHFLYDVVVLNVNTNRWCLLVSASSHDLCSFLEGRRWCDFGLLVLVDVTFQNDVWNIHFLVFRDVVVLFGDIVKGWNEGVIQKLAVVVIVCAIFDVGWVVDTARVWVFSRRLSLTSHLIKVFST